MSVKNFFLFLAFATAIFSADTTLNFNPASPGTGPFPSDVLTVSDAAQKTGKRINLPFPQNCQGQPTSDCLDTMMLNQLDGFSLAPRLQLCFSGGEPAVATIPRGLFVFALNQPSRMIRVTQVFYDPATRCAFAKPESILQQSTAHVLVATSDILDTEGKQVKPSKEFKDCLKGGSSQCSAMVNALVMTSGRIPTDDRYIGASVFTTLSASAWLEKARDFVNQPATPSMIIPLGPPAGFPLAFIDKFIWQKEINIDGTKEAVPIPTNLLLPHVGRVSFGLFLSPNFLAVSGQQAGSIPQLPTTEFQPPSAPSVPGFPPGFIPVGVHVWLPSSPKPAGGYPFAIYGHGLTDNRFGATTLIAATLAKSGIATVALEVQGHGYGQGSFVQLEVGGSAVPPLPTPGRGVSIYPDGSIGALDGCILPGPIATRDCTRQSVVDVFALLRAITTSGGYFGELDPGKASIVGQSFGSMFGAIASVLDTKVKHAVFNVPGGSPVTIARLQQFHPVAVFFLQNRLPPLLNLPWSSPPNLRYDFDDNYVFRNDPPRVNNVPGAAPIQSALEVADWLNMPGDPLAYVAGLNRLPVLFQFAKGDWEVPNPTNSAFIRTAGGRLNSRYFRFDLAQAVAGPALPPQPHRFLSNPEMLGSPAQLAIAMAAQEQVAGFLASAGATIPDANSFLTAPFNGMTLFETPAVLPEVLNFGRIPLPPPAP